MRRRSRPGRWFPLFVVLLTAASLVPQPLLAKKKADDAGKKEEEGLPLEPARTITFSTEEGTWLSLDVSPDGKTLVLELMGDLYTLPASGGEATRITEGLPFDSQPRYSPDGKWIAFLSDRDGSENVWIARADGSEPRKLSSDDSAEFASPAWTPSGDYVIASRSSWGLGTYELWMYHVDGGKGVQITKAKSAPNVPRNARHNAIGVSCSPDGRYLYYAVRQGGFTYNAHFPLWQIARRDRITGDEDVLTQALGSGIRPAISPDGTLLIYGTRHDAETGLRVRDLRTGDDDWLAYPVQRDDQESLFTRDLLPGYAFTPDSRAIILSYGGRLHRVRIADGEATEIPFHAEISQGLGPRLHFPQKVETGPVRARLIQSPKLSPDGTRVAFSSLAHLYVADLSDGAPRRVTTSPAGEFQPTWSPDGRWLAYVTWSAAGGDLWKVPADGGAAPQRLSRASAFYSDPAWAPDGERIVLLRGPTHERVQGLYDFGGTPGMDMVWIPAEGGDANLVLPARGLGSPHFTDDPDRIFVYLSGGLFSGSDSPSGLVSIRFDGTDRRQYLKVTGPGLYFAEEPVPADDLRMRPDGHWALAHVKNQLWLVAVPKVGGDAPVVNVDSPGVPVKRLTEVGADYFDWSADGGTITWAVGSTFYRQAFDGISFEEEEEKDADDSDDAAKTDRKKHEEPPPWKATEIVVELPRHTPHGTILLRGGHAVTMRGDEVIENADIVVTDDRIVAVGAQGSVEVPAGAHVVDVQGKTIVPGFVDTHAHWLEIRRGVMDLQNWSFLANLAYGVTTGLDVQTSTNDMFAYEDLVDAGVIDGPRAFSTGPGIFSDNAFSSLEEVKGVLERYRDHYRTHNLKSYIVGNRKQREWMVQASRELEMMPTTEGGLDLKLDLTHVLDGFAGNEHALPIVPLYDDVIRMVAESRIAYTPTLLVLYGGPFAENFFYTTENVHDDPKLRRFHPHEEIDSKALRRPWFHQQEQAFPKTAASAARIVRAGGLVGIGSHGQLQGLGYHWEMWALASGGLTPHEVLRCATILGAEIIGRETELGSLEAGKLADLVVLDKNPLEEIRNTNTVDLVLKNGELFDGDTLDRIWPDPRPLEPLWWWDDDPR